MLKCFNVIIHQGPRSQVADHQRHVSSHMNSSFTCQLLIFNVKNYNWFPTYISIYISELYMFT